MIALQSRKREEEIAGGGSAVGKVWGSVYLTRLSPSICVLFLALRRVYLQ